jgi:hypothetical protein
MGGPVENLGVTTGNSANGFNTSTQEYQAGQIQDPNPPDNNTNTNTNSNPNASNIFNDVANQYTDAANAVDAQSGIVGSNWDTTLANQQGDAKSSMQTSQGNNDLTQQNQVSALNTNTNANYNSLMSLLARSGAGVSSAASDNVPTAVAQNAATGMGGINTTYNENDATIQQSYKDALNNLLTQYTAGKGGALEALQSQKASDEQNAIAAEGEAAAYGGLTPGQVSAAEASSNTGLTNSQNAISALMTQYATPSFTPTPVPNLASYSYSPTTVAAQGANPNGISSAAPFISQVQQSNMLTGSNTTPAPAGG